MWLFGLFSKFYKTSADRCFLVYVLVIIIYSYKTQVAKTFIGLVDENESNKI